MGTFAEDGATNKPKSRTLDTGVVSSSSDESEKVAVR